MEAIYSELDIKYECHFLVVCESSTAPTSATCGEIHEKALQETGAVDKLMKQSYIEFLQRL
jgi:hypothetical protein